MPQRLAARPILLSASAQPVASAPPAALLTPDTAGIWRFDARRKEQDQVKDGRRFAAGTRKSAAIAWNRVDGQLHLVQYGLDQQGSLHPTPLTGGECAEPPAKETYRLAKGSNAGWPCACWDTRVGAWNFAPVYGGDGERRASAEDGEEPVLDPIVGSWNRTPPAPGEFKIVFEPICRITAGRN